MKIFRTKHFPLALILVAQSWLHAQDTTKAVGTAAPADTAQAKSDSALSSAPAAPAPETESKAKVDATEKVIVVGYGAMKKKDVTGSVSVVDSKDFKKANTSSVASALQGKASGVTITHNSGQPGKAAQVRVRGMGSINNSDPLYVVDGMPTSNIDYLNPLDIESMVVLKDASSTSIYGSRGANGVIVITTKKGTPGAATVTYNGTYGVSSPWKKPSFVSGLQWAQLHNEAKTNAGDTTGLIDINSLTPQQKAGTDWFGAVTRNNAVNYGNNFSLTQGDKNLNYFLSGGNTKDEGLIRGSDSKKTSVRANVNAHVNSWLSVGNSVGFTNTQTNYANESDEWNSTLITAISMNPTIPIYDSAGNLSPSDGASQVLNPVGVVQRNHDFSEDNRLKGDIFATIKPLNFLELKTTYGLDVSNSDSSVFLPAYFIGGPDQRSNSIVDQQTGTEYDWDWENTASIDQSFGDHRFKLLGGITASENSSDFTHAQATNTPTNDPSQRYLSSAQNATLAQGFASSDAMLSYFGRLNYDYDLKYFLSASVRADGSSKFGPENRWGYFPSVGVGWEVSKESFMRNVAWMNYLKLRGGWGIIGNANIDNYQYTNTTTALLDYPFGKAYSPGATFISAANPAVKWEGQQSQNIGLDFNLFQSMVEFTSDFYIKKTTNMLLRVPVPGQSGLGTDHVTLPPFTNAGDVQNKGFDLNLTVHKDVGNFTSKFTANFSLYRNKVTSLGDSGNVIPSVPLRDMGYVSQTEVGHPIAEFYGLETDGLFQDQAALNAFAAKGGDTSGLRPGDIRYKIDSTGAPIKGYIGSPHPDFTYGFGLDLGYKTPFGAFDFYAFFQGSQGNKIYNGMRFYTDQTTALFNLDSRMLNRWTPTNHTNDVATPRMNEGDINNSAVISDRYVEDGSYMRLKTITLGYTLPANLAANFKVPEIRIYVGASNLLTLTKYSGLDPEVGSGRFSGSSADNPANEGGLDIGVDRANYPQPRTIFTGIDVSL